MVQVVAHKAASRAICAMVAILATVWSTTLFAQGNPVATPLGMQSLPIAAKPLVRFYSRRGAGNLLTSDVDEIYRISNLLQGDWGSDRIGFVPQVKSARTVAVYRYFNSKSQDHFYTADQNEGSLAIKYLGYRSEGICCYLYPSQDAARNSDKVRVVTAPFVRPIYRWQSGEYHFYTVEAQRNGFLWSPKRPTYLGDDAKFEGELGWIVDASLGIQGVPTYAP